MKISPLFKAILSCCFLLIVFPNQATTFSNLKEDVLVKDHIEQDNDLFIAVDSRVEQFFDVLSDKLNKPFILSSAVKKKRISGRFDVSSPKTAFDTFIRRMAFIYFNDGNVIYVYDGSEMKQQMLNLKKIDFKRVKEYLHAIGLYDPRYPLRGGSNNKTFYVSEPPIYVKLVQAAAEYLDQEARQLKQDIIEEKRFGNDYVHIFALKNTFVTDRSYSIRGEKLVLPGISTVLQQLFQSNKQRASQTDTKIANIDEQYQPEPSFVTRVGKESIELMPLPGSSSLLAKGSIQGIQLINEMIQRLDQPKRQIELSLWIIDIAKHEADLLGIDWQSSYHTKHGNFLLNTSDISAAAGVHFLAKIRAMSLEGNAQMVSRTIILTQENTPAIFDNSTTFYTQVRGERTATLESATFGTMISVLPRLSPAGNEIEMVINLEDGAEKKPTTVKQKKSMRCQ
ncbi:MULTISPECIES: type III secretion system outer membrane ring subunit SctC [unclassified Arsenophonus]|uniref:type III secretion system outer membrane ring subunit SctC n=1 Tax=unclassified Arsenophonus TaxID=2627083 RepID=UPI002855952E|nr:type III secretion system outer membrane ring subunit SctC [Arsenophonus sp.]MDR5609220.1 type III secretion system outer membrane ring subunit SctC [Arsenophonus sp.]MDR5612952.1 type III secretion system outer membrane ring subunit SctC [Arsenophonus sp.]